MNTGMRTGKLYPYVCPSDKSLVKIKMKMKALTGRELTPLFTKLAKLLTFSPLHLTLHFSSV
jgi:hypothetical protein